MLTNANFLGENITDFDFKNPETRERLELWLSHTRSKIRADIPLSEKDLEKISEFFCIIEREGKYKIPRKKGEKKKAEPSFQKLVYYYQAKLEREGSSATEAIEQSASRFVIPFKTAQRYRDTHKKAVDLMIEKFGFDEIAEHYEFHLSLMKDTGRGFKPINFK